LDQLVLDEIGLAIELGYLSHVDVLSVLELRPSAMDVIVTGPAIPEEMMEMADQVTELRRGF
jgi:cob(I)alamin adenosyltransferase